MPNAIVTGASRGLGLELSRVLVQHGWTVIADARTPFEEEGVTVLTGDVTDPAHRKALVSQLDHIDLLINNAGALGPSPLPPLRTTPLEAFREVYETNVFAPLALIQEALPKLQDAIVVNVTSDAAPEPYAGWGVYGSSKAALEAASRVLAVEEPSLTVWQVDPGDLRTQMHQDAYPGEDISDRPLPSVVAPRFIELLDKRPPSGRYQL